MKELRIKNARTRINIDIKRLDIVIYRIVSHNTIYYDRKTYPCDGTLQFYWALMPNDGNVIFIIKSLL